MIEMLFAKMAQWSVSEWADVIETTFVIIGGALALFQWWQNSKAKKAEYINALMEKLRSDDDMKDALMEFEYNASWYTTDFHNSNDGLEQKVDKLLQYYTYICYLKKNCLLSKREFCLFQYEIVHTLSNKGVQDYLYNIYHFSKRVNTEKDNRGLNKSYPFYHLVKFGIRKDVIPRDFMDKKACLNSNKYHHVLNI